MEGFEKLVGTFGKVLNVAEETKSMVKMDCAKVLIRTSYKTPIISMKICIVNGMILFVTLIKEVFVGEP